MSAQLSVSKDRTTLVDLSIYLARRYERARHDARMSHLDLIICKFRANNYSHAVVHLNLT